MTMNCHNDCRTSPRIILCEVCGSEGRIYTLSCRSDEYGNQMEYSEPCPYCEGTGGEIIETEPITMEDLDIPPALTEPL